MSGRSAYVRAKKLQLADETTKTHQSDYASDRVLYGWPSPRMLVSKMTMPVNPLVLSPPPRRRQSVSSSCSAFMTSGQSPRKPRPIVVASAIEKSDFRTHFDGMSRSVRGTLGKLIKGVDEPARLSQLQLYSDVVPADSSSGLTPSLAILPPMSPPADRVTSPTFPSPRSKHPPLSGSRAMKRFEGAGKRPQPEWKSLANNPELWDDGGDTLIYMYMRGLRVKPPPSFRVSSAAIYESGATALINQLHDTSVPQGWPRFCPSDMPSPDGTDSPTGTLEFMDLHRTSSEVGDPSTGSTLGAYRKPASTIYSYGIRHELYIAWPGPETGVESVDWHVATRNFFAMLYNSSSLVGASLYDALVTVFERISMHSDYLRDDIDKVALIADFLQRHKFDDVRNNPSGAATLLAFSETPHVQWRDGYREAFVHCAGMLNMGLQTVAEWSLINPHTRLLLQSASLEMEERIHRAQAWLFSFDFGQMWPTTSAPPSSARLAFERLRKWLCKYYEKDYRHWPPAGKDHSWLTHDLVARLRNDFYGLYDYLVDHEIIFDGIEYRPGQKWAIVSQSGQPFNADTDALPFTDILLGFDNRHGFPHIPYPYPKTPPSTPIVSRFKSPFAVRKPATQSELLAQSRRKALAYHEASNMYTLKDRFANLELVQHFISFEQTDMLDSVDPFDARRGRWLLIYGVLQVLGTIAVDSPTLRYRQGVQYHISPKMRGVVPWAEAGAPAEEEASHTKSHPWVVAPTWAVVPPRARRSAHKPIIWGPYGDGRSRTDSDLTSFLPAPETSTTTSVGRRRAAEWVANTATAQLETITPPETISLADSSTRPATAAGTGPALGFPSDVHTSRSVAERTHGALRPDGSGIARGDAVVVDPANTAKKRRALIYGFSDFQPPSDW